MSTGMASSTGSTAIPGDLTTSLFHTSRAVIIVDRPAPDVWSVLTDLSFPTVKSWNPTVAGVKHISGERRKENEFVLVTKDTEQAPFYMRTIRMIPNFQRVLRVDAIDGTFATFVDHSLYEVNGKTTLVYNGYYEARRVSADQVREFDFRKAEKISMDYLNEAFGLLKKVVEKRFP